jgi:nucleoside-diphosphate-sugar epimerase
VLITGASGFLASHVIHEFLSHGYNVRGTVRSESAGEQVKAKHSQYASQLSTVLVPDLAVPHALDEAIKGVTGVIHTASPFLLNVEDNERDLLQPAIKSTLNIFDAIQAYNPSIRRVVVTSSFASILDLDKGLRPGHNYVEDDWNPASYEIAKSATDGAFAYCASKALAERAAWDWIARNNPSFSLTTICPPWVFGPGVSADPSLNRLNESLEVIYSLITGHRADVPPTDFAAFVDVRDVAHAHLVSFESEEAANQRFITAGGHFDYHTACDIIRQRFPSLQDKVPKDVSNLWKSERTYTADGSKAGNILGLRYRSLETTLVDTVEWLLERDERMCKPEKPM